MAIEIKQHLKLQQQLVMTPQLQQAIKLLQLSRMELADTIRDEILENPILEMIRRPPRSTLFPYTRFDLGGRRIIRSESTRLNSSHTLISYAVFFLKKKKTPYIPLLSCLSLHSLLRL